jgi:hypothetical protein
VTLLATDLIWHAIELLRGLWGFISLQGAAVRQCGSEDCVSVIDILGDNLQTVSAVTLRYVWVVFDQVAYYGGVLALLAELVVVDAKAACHAVVWVRVRAVRRQEGRHVEQGR